jgi:hypothetical protein
MPSPSRGIDFFVTFTSIPKNSGLTEIEHSPKFIYKTPIVKALFSIFVAFGEEKANCYCFHVIIAVYF